MTGGSCRIPCDGDLEALLEQLAQMRLDAHVRQHPAKDAPVDAPLAQLQDQVVGLRTEHPVGTDDDGLAIFDVRLESMEPVGARSSKPLEVQTAAAGERALLVLHRLEGSVEFPASVFGEEVVGRDEDLVPAALGGLEDALHVFDRPVLPNAFPNGCPRHTLFAQDVVLRVGEDHCGVDLVDFHLPLSSLTIALQTGELPSAPTNLLPGAPTSPPPFPYDGPSPSCAREGQASVSCIQSRLRIGYNRAPGWSSRWSATASSAQPTAPSHARSWPARGTPAAGGLIEPKPGGLEIWASGTTLSL